MSTCLVCTLPLAYASPYYRHAADIEQVAYATCRPPAAPGKAVCWNCGAGEGPSLSSYYQHDFMGWGKFTCPKIERLNRCIVCREPECVASRYYKHAYVPEDKPDATCAPPQLAGHRKCWVCGVGEANITTRDGFMCHDFTGARYPQSNCLANSKPPIFGARCPNCREPVGDVSVHEDSFGDGMGCGGGGYKCAKAK